MDQTLQTLLAVDQSTINPRDRWDTLPPYSGQRTLGFGVIAWIYDNLTLPDGDPDQPFRLTKRQSLFLLHWYALDDDGRFLHSGGASRLAKGSGKSPFAAVMALAELLGPVRFDRWDASVPGGAIGKPTRMAWVQISATSESQTANTMDMVTQMASKRSKLAKKYKLDVGKTYVRAPEIGAKLEQITSSTGSTEGARTTFVVCDETEHWTPAQGGKGLKKALKRNCTKKAGRLLETCNAWDPGAGSVAEATFEAWVAQQTGAARSERPLLYDSIQAPPNTSLSDKPKPGEIGIREGIAYVYHDCPWVPQEEIIEGDIWQPDSDPSLSRRFYLNQPVARTGAWVPPQQWAALADPKRELEPGEEIVLFFDGSKSNDHTALVGCCMEDGHVFTVGVWEPQEQLDGTKEVDVHAVDAAVQDMRETYTVVGFWADVREFESFVKTKWPRDFEDEALLPAGKSGLPSDLIAWDMRSKSYNFALAVEMTYDEIQSGEFTHDGHPATSEHMANAVVFEQRNGRISIRKESPKSARKIDAAVCVIGARMVYRAVKESPSYQKRNHYYPGGWVL